MTLNFNAFGLHVSRDVKESHLTSILDSRKTNFRMGQYRSKRSYIATIYYPIKNYRGLSPNYRGKRWAYVHFIGGAANYPIIYP